MIRGVSSTLLFAVRVWQGDNAWDANSAHAICKPWKMRCVEVTMKFIVIGWEAGLTHDELAD